MTNRWIRRYYIACKKEYPINFINHGRKFCLSLHYNGANNYVFVNDV